MVSLFLGVLAVVVVQAGASIAERALLADLELTSGIDGTKVMDLGPEPRAADIVVDTVAGRSDAMAMLTVSAIIGEPGVRPVNEGASPIGESCGSSQVCRPDGTCEEAVSGPPGEAVEVRLTALTGDVRPFRPLRPRSGEWLDFATVPAMAPRLVVNLEAAKGLTAHRVPAEMRIGGAAAHVTPQVVGVVLAETLLTGLLTAAAAIGVSVAGLKAVSVLLGDGEPFLRDVQFPWDAGLAGVFAGLIAGILGGFVPALRAARIPIATVMRA